MTEVVVRQDLATGNGRRHAFRTRVRAAGQAWAGDGSGELADLLAEAAAGDPELTELVRTGGALLADFLEGYRRSVDRVRTSGDLAKDLVDGLHVRPEQEMTLAPDYLVALVRWSGRGRAETQRADGALRHAVGPDLLATSTDSGLVLLVPSTDNQRTARTVTQIKRFLGGNGWLVTATRPRREIRDGVREAAEVLRLVMAGRRPCGAYTMLDVLVEYAVVQDEAVAAQLAAMIRPLRGHAVLWETLMALIDADYQRNKTARNLFVHRSTLDYRLQRIAAVTGCDPTTGRGAQLLTAALIAGAVRDRGC
ncbi:helix-turn-helix domain-containing protein [Lentzea sp. BCCO 10_0798]|uniref:Helix-turn-helix domain-containing protein n=1 Tax=Lentzea kristufekii TaxID=3095430 RepID=A0ABU4U7H4_9PSEU|nr:helix-turn-helix domain-containing protein [Lentzea sp. BCCO 10_0798]MDX8056159.1 helix-turn-helix domain-containing protein [Lentzea sp. BCCO 10_0798]